MTGRMTMEDLDRVVRRLDVGLGLVAGAPLQIGFANHEAEISYVEGTYERSVMLGDPIRIVAITVRRADGWLTSIPWEQIAYIDALPSEPAS